MSPTMNFALQSLHQSGRVVLPGAPAVYPDTARGWIIVVLMFVSLLPLGLLLLAVLLAIATDSLIAGIVTFGFLVLGPFTFAAVVWWRYFRWRRKYAELPEQVPVTMDPNGLTMRGVGPIAWSDFGPAMHKLLPAEFGHGLSASAVLPLTDRGIVMMNQHMPPDLSQRVTPIRVAGGHSRYLEVPGIQGLSQREVMDLINAAHRVFVYS